jgi:hypothetical protein
MYWLFDAISRCFLTALIGQPICLGHPSTLQWRSENQTLPLLFGLKDNCTEGEKKLQEKYAFLRSSFPSLSNNTHCSLFPGVYKIVPLTMSLLYPRSRRKHRIMKENCVGDAVLVSQGKDSIVFDRHC